MKKILIFLICCAVGYTCWTAFIDSGTESEVTTTETATEAPADTTMSEVKGIDELPEDTMLIDSVMPAK